MSAKAAVDIADLVSDARARWTTVQLRVYSMLAVDERDIGEVDGRDGREIVMIGE